MAKASCTCAKLVDPQRGVMSHLEVRSYVYIDPLTVDIACTVSALG